MRQLTPRELAAILNELQRQIKIEQYNEQRNKWAFLAAVITNGFATVTGMFSKRKPKMVNPDDFLSKDAKKIIQRMQDQSKQSYDWSRHLKDAKLKGLRGPW